MVNIFTPAAMVNIFTSKIIMSSIAILLLFLLGREIFIGTPEIVVWCRVSGRVVVCGTVMVRTTGIVVGL